MARKAKSLDTLLAQVSALYPNRSKSSDGWIGDAAHAARKSDHNPNSAGVVQALDITHDPAHGLDAGKLAETLLASRDQRIKYIISNRRISSNGKWTPYSGENAHTQHVHVSVSNSAALYDDVSPWKLGAAAPAVEPQPPALPTKNTYDEALRRLLVHEGGYGDHPSDPGGPTNFGITIHDYRLYIDADGTADDVRNMKVAEAKIIYKEKYWDKMNCAALPAGVDYAVFDYGVNSGTGRAPKVLQRVLGFSGANVDNIIGPATLAAVNKRDPKELINAICDERMTYLRSLTGWSVFGKGWTRRVTEVRAAALAMAASPNGRPVPPPVKHPVTTAPPPPQSWWASFKNLFGY